MLWLGLFTAACGGRAAPPTAGASQGGIPDLRGVQVMVLPSQSVVGLPVSPDHELAFALAERAPGVRWLTPDDLRRVLARSPGVRIDIDALAVGIFLRGEVQRVGDPLFGDLRRLAAMTDAEVALIPVRVRFRPGTEGVPAATEIAAALVNARSGRVYWFGVVDGVEGVADDPRVLASAADALARRFSR